MLSVWKFSPYIQYMIFCGFIGYVLTVKLWNGIFIILFWNFYWISRPRQWWSQHHNFKIRNWIVEYLSLIFQMETPRTRSSTRQRRAPTPKLSERKKNLFPDVNVTENSPIIKSPYVRLERIIIEEDSDLGPMSPLEFSSSPSSFNEVHRIISREQKGTITIILQLRRHKSICFSIEFFIY